MHTRIGVCFVLFVLYSAVQSNAQVPNLPSPLLLKITAVKCSFPLLTTGNWKNGAPESATTRVVLNVWFDDVDTQDGTAVAVSAAGKSHITARLVGNYLHFMQMDPYGAMYLTTVFSTETRGGKLQAVHSRHEFTPVSVPNMTSRPEQYIGECETFRR